MRINKNILKKREVLVLGVIAVIMIVMGMTTQTFLTVNNMMSVAIGLCGDGFLALAMTFILISGQIDLSVGAVQCLASMFIGQMYIYYGMNIWLATLLALLFSMVLGWITGSLVARLNHSAVYHHTWYARCCPRIVLCCFLRKFHSHNRRKCCGLPEIGFRLYW